MHANIFSVDKRVFTLTKKVYDFFRLLSGANAFLAPKK